MKNTSARVVLSLTLTCWLSLLCPPSGSAQTNFTIKPPTFPSSNTVLLILQNIQTNVAYDILYASNLNNGFSWFRYATGGVGQTQFTVNHPTGMTAFFQAMSNYATIPVAATPAFSPTNQYHFLPTNITITCATSNALIYYTINGATPTSADIPIASGGSVYLPTNTTLKARAYRSSYTESAVQSQTYYIHQPMTVSAGPQQVISGSSATLQGYVITESFPNVSTTNTWSKVRGPGTVTFNNANQTNTSATFSAAGVYELKLESKDGYYIASNQVVIARSPTVAVTLTSPTNGSTYTVPTNFTLSATASCPGYSVTQVTFYAGSILIGKATTEPFSVEWRNAYAGTHALRAVAETTDSANTGLASTNTVTVTVNWPTNVGQVVLSQTDLQIPLAGLPITVTRQYDSRWGAEGAFGYNWKLDYEEIKIEKSGSMASGWTGKRSGLTYYFAENTAHLVTVSFGPNEKYYFRPVLVFTPGDTESVNSAVVPRWENGYRGRIIFAPLSGSFGTLTANDSGLEIGFDDGLLGWNNVTVTPVLLEEDDFGDLVVAGDYDPALSALTFTAPDGIQYKFDSNGKLYQKIDRNGNSLTFADTYIYHSSGKQVSFSRDGNNRIYEVYDPIALETSGPAALVYSYSSSGNLTNVAQLVDRAAPLYRNTGYGYTNTTYTHHITSITDARGVTVQRHEFDSSGRLSKQYDALSRATTYYYDLTGHRQIITNRLNDATTQTFASSGLLGSVQDATGAGVSYGYDVRGRKIAETNALGQVITYGYDSQDQLTAVTNELQQASQATYNQWGQILTASDNLNYTTANGYDNNGNLVAVTNAANLITRYGYDVQGNRTAETNAFGTALAAVTQYSYNEYGWLTNVTDPLNNSVGYSYDANGNRMTETKIRTLPGGGQESLTTSWTYDGANRLLQTITPDGFTNRLILNAIGKQETVIDKLGRTNLFAYDAIGLLTNITYPDNLTERFAYDAEGHRTNSVNRADYPTSFTYDKSGRLERTLYADGGYTENNYDNAGRLKATVQGANAQGSPPSPEPTPITTAYGYDAAGRRTAVTNAFGRNGTATVTRFGYDANGNQTNQVDNLSRTNTFAYDALGRQIKVTYPDQSWEGFGYDALGRRVAATNQAGIITRFGYDLAGRLTAVTNAYGATPSMVTRYEYDELGSLLRHIDALNRTNKFEYDPMGRKSKNTLPGSQAESFGYDAIGNLIRHTNFNSAVLTNQYDNLNRLTNRVSGSYQITFKYNATGQRTNMVDASGTTTYTYDSRDRMTQAKSPQGTLNYAYDGFGNLYTLQSATANGVALTYTYDALQRLTNAAVGGLVPHSAAYSYDGVGNLSTVIYGTAVTNTYQYNSLNRLTNLTAKTASATLATFSYGLGAAGNRTSLSETVNSASRTFTWGYDSLYRLTNEVISGTAPTGTISYKYDAVGNRTNRTSSVTGVATASYSYGTNDWLSTDVYDSNGNTRTNAGIVYLYDVANRLTNFNAGAAIYVYDGDGNRVRKTVSGVTTLYLVSTVNPSGYAQVMEELTVSGGATNLSRVYAYGLDLISQRDSSSNVIFYGYDGNGNTRYLTATNGTITDTYVYDAFGIQIASSGSTPNAYLYSGEQYDPNMGFYYLRARYLNSATGRFWTRDSFAGRYLEPISLHRYLYVHNNPINRLDPSGHDIGTLGGLMGGLGGRDVIEGIQLPAINMVKIKAIAKISVIAVALSATLAGDDAPGNYVYRRLSDEQAASPYRTVGIWATDPSAFHVTPSEHIRGTDRSPWISSSRRFGVTTDIFNINPLNPIVKINLNIALSPYLDFSNPALLATLDDDYVRGLATMASEVLIFRHVPGIAIVGVIQGK